MNSELENRIRKVLKIHDFPSRDSLALSLTKLESPKVTELPQMRYTKVASTFIHNKIADVLGAWKLKPVYLVPSFIIVFIIFVGAFNLSPISNAHHHQTLEQLARDSATIEENDHDADDQLIITSFDEPAIDELSTTQNEL